LRLFRVFAFAWPLIWILFTLALLSIQGVAILIFGALLIPVTAAGLANMWGGVLVWRHSGRCPAWLPWELLLFVGTPSALFVVASAFMKKVGWAGP
jgi:hypothetical protein